MTEEETKKKMSEAMNAPPSDFVKFWKLMDESAAETMQIKLYKNEGDEKPFRAIILVQGKTAVKEVLKLIDDREKNEA